MRVFAVVLAAGEGRRMGGAKALLTLGGRTLLDLCAERIARPGVEAVYAVLGHDAERVAREGGAPALVRLLTNPDHGEGMLSSVLCGLEAADAAGADAILLHPVDHPLVEAETVDRVVEALTAGARIAVPTHAGRRGHPGGFARATFPALRAAPPGVGARAVLADHADWIVHVRGGPGSLAGINTPEDYARLARND